VGHTAALSLPDEEHAKAFVATLLDRVREGDGDAVAEAFDMEQVLPAGPIPPHIREMMHEDACTMAQQVLGMLSEEEICYRLIRLHKLDGELRALIRVALSDDFDYVDLALVQLPTGDVRLANVYGYSSGRNIRDELRNAAALEVSDAERIVSLAKALQAQEFGEVLRRYETLPESLRQGRNVQHLRLQAAARVDKATLLSALEDYRNLFPGDISADLLLLRQGPVSDEPELAMACIRRIDDAVGGDIFLNVLRSKAALLRAEYAEAVSLARSVIDAEPDLVPAYWALIRALVREGNHAESVKWLRAADARRPLDEDACYAALLESPDSRKFIESAEYREFLAEKQTPGLHDAAR
jgi:tetratricopeptide (TPR) repeat protein